MGDRKWETGKKERMYQDQEVFRSRKRNGVRSPIIQTWYYSSFPAR